MGVDIGFKGGAAISCAGLLVELVGFPLEKGFGCCVDDDNETDFGMPEGGGASAGLAAGGGGSEVALFEPVKDVPLALLGEGAFM